jgi:putative transposase
MRQSLFSEEQMVKILREADAKPIGEVAKKHGVSDQTIYAWRKQFGTLDAADVKRLRQLEQENGRLKKLLAERDLDIELLKEVLRKNVWLAPALQGDSSDGDRPRQCIRPVCGIPVDTLTSPRF